MTQQEFDKVEWGPDMQVEYHLEPFSYTTWWVKEINVRERLLGLWPYFLDPRKDEYYTLWARCEHVTLNSEIINMVTLDTPIQ